MSGRASLRRTDTIYISLRPRLSKASWKKLQIFGQIYLQLKPQTGELWTIQQGMASRHVCLRQTDIISIDWSPENRCQREETDSLCQQ